MRRKYARLKVDTYGYDPDTTSAALIPEGTIITLGSWLTLFMHGKIVVHYDLSKRNELFEMLE